MTSNRRDEVPPQYEQVRAAELHVALEGMLRGQPAQPLPWADAQQARTAVRSRRLRLCTGAVAGAVIVAALAAPFLVTGTVPAPAPVGLPAAGESSTFDAPLQPRSYVAPEWAPAAADYVPEEVSAAEALQRCNSIVYAGGENLQSMSIKADQTPIYAGDDVSGVLEDTVTDSQGDSGTASIGCTVPGSWSDGAAFPADLPTSASDTDEILLACSRLRQIDLRSWTVAAAMSDGYGGIAASLVSPGQGFYAKCEFEASHGEIIFSNHASPADLRRQPLGEDGLRANSGDTCYYPGGVGFDGSLPPDSVCVGQVHSWAGVLPETIDSVSITQADGTVLDVPVGVHGTYAMRFVVPLDAPAPRIRAYDAEGGLVYEGSMTE